jgi:hypothetical protein
MFPTGYALGHSIFVAVPIGLVILAVSRHTDRMPFAIAGVVGYWSHLLADVLDPLRYAAPPAPGRVLWPFVAHTPYEQDLGLGRGLAYLENFLASLQSMDPVTVVVLYLLIPLGTVILWIYDGGPGLAALVRVVQSHRRRKR